METTTAPVTPSATGRLSGKQLWLNDCHSQLNKTRVAAVVRPRGLDDLIKLVRKARSAGKSLIPFGGKHAMGGPPHRREYLLVGCTSVHDLCEWLSRRA